ncbi:unnamed protein product [Gordionus sp. m RMFG-2023]
MMYCNRKIFLSVICLLIMYLNIEALSLDWKITPNKMKNVSRYGVRELKIFSVKKNIGDTFNLKASVVHPEYFLPNSTFKYLIFSLHKFIDDRNVDKVSIKEGIIDNTVQLSAWHTFKYNDFSGKIEIVDNELIAKITERFYLRDHVENNPNANFYTFDNVPANCEYRVSVRILFEDDNEELYSIYHLEDNIFINTPKV